MKGGPHQLYFVLLLGLLAGYSCATDPPTVDSETSSTAHLLTGSDPSTSTGATSATGPITNEPTQDRQSSVKIHSNVSVESGPASVIIAEAHSATLTCKFRAPPNASVTWTKYCSPSCTDRLNVTNTSNREISVNLHKGLSTLFFHRTERNDTGMYYCLVHAFPEAVWSCGTYLWVRKAHPTSFLNMRESVKNKIITAEGFLLLICAIGPGLFLLFRKRWENELLLEAKKKKHEEENLYEGLNLDDCSMYEDISRGLQATYQDIGNVKVIDLQLEKPEKP